MHLLFIAHLALLHLSALVALPLPVLGDVVTEGFNKIKDDVGPIFLVAMALAGVSGYLAHAAGYNHASNHLRTAFLGAAAASLLIYGGGFFTSLFTVAAGH